METVRPSTFGNPLLKDYHLDNTFDEMFTEDGLVRPHYAEVLETFMNLPPEEIARRKRSVDLSFLTQGITFNVYGHGEGTERIFPYDLLPRLITWALVSGAGDASATEAEVVRSTRAIVPVRRLILVLTARPAGG